MLTLGILSGCGASVPSQPSAAQKLTMEKAEEINNVAHLLGLYKTVTYAQLDYIGGEVNHTIFFKDENGTICQVSEGNGYVDYQTETLSFSLWNGVKGYHISATENGFFYNYLLMGHDGKLVSQTVDANGNLACETKADISQDYADGLSGFGVTTADKLITKPVFASDDYRELSIDYIILHPDGSEVKIASAVLLYDQEVTYPDTVQDYLDAEKYTVTIQLPEGDTRTAEIPGGAVFTWSCDAGYALYLDGEGKTPLGETSDPVQGNMTLYCLAAQ